jgi:hypothetical protein
MTVVKGDTQTYAPDVFDTDFVTVDGAARGRDGPSDDG